MVRDTVGRRRPLLYSVVSAKPVPLHSAMHNAPPPTLSLLERNTGGDRFRARGPRVQPLFNHRSPAAATATTRPIPREALSHQHVSSCWNKPMPRIADLVPELVNSAQPLTKWKYRRSCLLGCGSTSLALSHDPDTLGSACCSRSV